MAHTVFISYADEDRAIAEKTRRILEERRISCWFAPRSLRGGVMWPEAIVKEIRECHALILIHSANANRSENVKREVSLAGERGIPFFVFQVEDIKFDDGLEYYLRRS